MTQDNIASIIDTVPGLNYFGIGVFEDGLKPLTDDERRTEFEVGRQRLLDDAETCTRIVDWLHTKHKAKRMNPKVSSYGLKHIAEQDLGYITNGAFIAAAIHAGFRYRTVEGDPNVYFNMSVSYPRGIGRGFGVID